jgi:MFS family permease
MKKLALLLALAAGIFVGYVDIHSSEVFIPVLLILGFAFIFGYLLPAIAWRLALLIGIGVPLVLLAAYYLGYEPKFVEELKKLQEHYVYNIKDVLGSVLVFIPAFIGVYGGVMLKKFFAGSNSKPDER